MNKKMREILAAIQAKTAEAKGFMEGENKDVDKATSLMDEIDAMRKEYDTEKRIFEAEKESSAPTEEEVATEKAVKVEADSVKAFAQAAREGFQVKDMSEGTAADGGYAVPVDIVSKVQSYRSAKASLLDLVRVTPVTTNKGERTFKKRAQQTGFAKVGEKGAIGAKATPQFERVSYEISKYAGYFPVTNEVLADSDENLANVLIEWIADESRVTANTLIKAAVDTKESVKFADLDGIKKALNVTLGQAFKATSQIVTNDNGLQYLDTLKDTTGRYLLAPIPGEAMAMGLQVGASIVPVKVIPNSDMPNGEEYVKTADTDIVVGKTYYTKSGDTYTAVSSPVKSSIGTYYAIEDRIPFIIGDLAEGVEYFDRQAMNIRISDTAKVGDLNAFEEDLTLYRAIEREDVQVRDNDAFVNGYIAETV